VAEVERMLVMPSERMPPQRAKKVRYAEAMEICVACYIHANQARPATHPRGTCTTCYHHFLSSGPETDSDEWPVYVARCVFAGKVLRTAQGRRKKRKNHFRTQP
jgi:hypothetical protein